MAYDYDIPLWNFWRAVQPLKDHGIDFARDPQGFHITTDAWNVRSYTALKAIDAVWKGISGESNPSNISTPTPNVEQPSAIETVFPEINSNTINGKIVFSLANRTGENTTFKGIFTYDPVLKTISNLVSSGYQLVDINQDGKTILINHGSNLYLSQLDPLEDPIFLANDYAQDGENAFGWIIDGTNVIYMRSTKNSSLEVILINTENLEKKILISQEADLKKIYYSNNSTGFFWRNSNSQYKWFSMSSETQITFIPPAGSENPMISPDNKYVAFINIEQNGEKNVNIAASDGSRIIPIQLPGTTILGYSWAPDSKKIAINMLTRSDYSGRWFGSKFFLVSVNDWGIIQLGEIKDNTLLMRWSPDSEQLLITGTRIIENQYEALLFSASILSRTINPILQNYLVKDIEYEYIPDLFWVN